MSFCCEAPAIATGADSETAGLMRQFGASLGRLFQARDDELDGPGAVSGKAAELASSHRLLELLPVPTAGSSMASILPYLPECAAERASKPPFIEPLADAHQPLHFSIWSLLEPAAMLCLMKVLLATIPFRWLCVGLGLTRRQASAQSTTPQAARVARLADRMRNRMAYIGGNYPALGLCVPQGMAAAAMLRLRGVGSTLHFGVLKTASAAEPLRAHAWLTIGDTVVTGDGTKVAFSELQPRAAGEAGTPELRLVKEERA